MTIQPSTLATCRPSMPACLSVEDTALQLGIGRTSVYALIKEGKLGSVKLGRRRVVPLQAITEMLQRMATLPLGA